MGLEEVGFNGSESRYMPASILSTILLDYILRKKGVNRELAPAQIVYLEALLDGAILGDMAYSNEGSQEGFSILDADAAEIIRFLSECGQEGLNVILEFDNLDGVRPFYDGAHVEVERKTAALAERMQKDPFNNPNRGDRGVIGMFFDDEDVMVAVNGHNLDIRKQLRTACCEAEKEKVDDPFERRIVVVGTVSRDQNLLEVGLRFDGNGEVFNLRHVLERLREHSVNPEMYNNGGGHEWAMNLRIPLGEEALDDREGLVALTQEIIEDIRGAVQGIYDEILMGPVLFREERLDERAAEAFDRAA
ncbi:hypothetical protein ACFL1F_01010 [Chlamydiota bacterium]